MKKRTISLLIVVAMVLSFIPIMTMGGAADDAELPAGSHSVQLVARDATNHPCADMDGETGVCATHGTEGWSCDAWGVVYRSEPVTITPDALEHTVTITFATATAELEDGTPLSDVITGRSVIPSLIQLGLLSEGGGFNEANPFAGVTPAPAEWDAATLEITNVSLNNSVIPNTFEGNLATPPNATATDLFVNAQLWNGFHCCEDPTCTEDLCKSGDNATYPGNALTVPAANQARRPGQSAGNEEPGIPNGTSQLLFGAGPITFGGWFGTDPDGTTLTSVSVTFKVIPYDDGGEATDTSESSEESSEESSPDVSSSSGSDIPVEPEIVWEPNLNGATSTGTGRNYVSDADGKGLGFIMSSSGDGQISVADGVLTVTNGGNSRRLGIVIAGTGSGNPSAPGVGFEPVDGETYVLSFEATNAAGTGPAALRFFVDGVDPGGSSVLPVSGNKFEVEFTYDASFANVPAASLSAVRDGTHGDIAIAIVIVGEAGTVANFSDFQIATAVPPPEMTPTVFYNLQNDLNLKWLVEGAGALPASEEFNIQALFPYIRKSGGENTSTEVDLAEKTVAISGRTGTSHGLQFRLSEIEPKDGYTYTFIVSGVLSGEGAATSRARLRYEPSSSTPFAAVLAPAAADGVFTDLSVTLTAAQIAANSAGFISIGCNTSGVSADSPAPDILYTKVQIISNAPVGSEPHNGVVIQAWEPEVDSTATSDNGNNNGDNSSDTTDTSYSGTTAPTSGGDPTSDTSGPTSATTTSATPDNNNNQGEAGKIQLVAKYASGDNWWVAENAHIRGNAVEVNGDGTYNLSIDVSGHDGLLSFALLSDGGFMDGDTRFKNSVLAPSSWVGAMISFDSITMGGVDITPTADTAKNQPLVADWAGSAGYLSADLWNAWYSANNRLSNVTIFPVGEGEDPGFALGGASTINVTITISGIQTTTSSGTTTSTSGGTTTSSTSGTSQSATTATSGTGTPATTTSSGGGAQLPQGDPSRGARVQLMARESAEWITTDLEDGGVGPWRSDSVLINGDGTYTLTLDLSKFYNSSTPSAYNSLIQIGLYSTSSYFWSAEPPNAPAINHRPWLVGDARGPGTGAHAPDMTFGYKWSDAVIEFTSIKFNNGAVTLAPPNVQEAVIADGYAATEGFVYIDLWNGWHEPNQRIGGVTPVQLDGTAFQLPGAAIMTNVEITFTVSGTGFRKPDAIIPAQGIGDANGDGAVTIADALEILKYLAKMSSTINPKGSANWNNALITKASFDKDEPGIADVLEILKKLAKMTNEIDTPTWVRPA